MFAKTIRTGTLLLAAGLMPLLHTLRPAEVQAQDTTQRAAILTDGETELLTAYLRADHATAFDRARAMLADGALLSYEEFRLSLRILGICAEELAYNQKHIEALRAAKPPKSAAGALNFEIAERLRRLGDPAKADAMDAELGVLKQWRVCGPFPNERGQGFDDPQAPEYSFDHAAEYTGKDGHSVSFRTLPVQPASGLLDLGAMLRPNKEATAYLATAVHSDRDAPVTLTAASDGPLKMWIGAQAQGALKDAFVITEAERNLGADQDRCTIKLSRGWNVIVVKSGVGEGRWRLRLRLDENGFWREADNTQDFNAAVSAPSNTQTVAPVAPVAASDKLRTMFLEGAYEQFLPRQDLVSGFARLRLTTLVSDYEKLAEVVASPHNYKQEKAVLKYLLAEASRSGTAVAAGREENRRRELLQGVLELDPKAARAAYSLAAYYSNTFVNPTQADLYARKAVELAPAWVEGRLFCSRVATLKGLDMEVVRELSGLLKSDPENPQVLRFAAYYRGLSEDYASALKLFERALKADFTDSYSRERLFTRAIERADAAAAARYANEIRQLDPFDIANWRELAQMHLALGELAQALSAVNRALAIAPMDDSFLALKCEVHMRFAATLEGQAAEGQRKLAINACRAALKANPNRQDLERYIEFLSDERPKFEALLQEDIEARIEDALALPVNSDDPCRIVYRDEITVVNEDGTTSRYLQYAYRVCNDMGRPWFQTMGVPLYEGQQGRVVEGRVYRMDGSVEEGRRAPTHVQFPPINVGDIVFLRYRISDREQGFFGEFFGTREAMAGYFMLGGYSIYVPTDEMRLVFVLPKSRQFHEYLTNGAPRRTEHAEGDHVIWSYTLRNLAKLPDEPLAPPLDQVAPTVQISSYKDWKEFGKWYYNLIKKQLEPTPAMEAKVRELVQGRATEKDKARAIYNFVITQIRYNADWHFGVHGYKPFSAGAIFDRCIGDCKDKAIVICTMLGIAGIKAWPVIVNLEEYRGNEDITLPMPHHFNHAIAYIEYADGGGQFVDGTATFNGMDELPSADAGAKVMVVKPDGGHRAEIPLPPAEQNRDIETISLELAGQGKARISVVFTGVGSNNSRTRNYYLREGERKRQIEQIWAEHFPGASANLIKANDLADVDVAPRLTYSMDLPGAYEEKDGVIELRVALNPVQWTQTRLGMLTSRKCDMVLPAPTSLLSTTRLELPKGKKLAQLVPKYLYEDDHVRLRVEVTLKDGVVTIEREYALKGGVLPKAAYPKFREGLAGFDRAEAVELKIVNE